MAGGGVWWSEGAENQDRRVKYGVPKLRRPQNSVKSFAMTSDRVIAPPSIGLDWIQGGRDGAGSFEVLARNVVEDVEPYENPLISQEEDEDGHIVFTYTPRNLNDKEEHYILLLMPHPEGTWVVGVFHAWWDEGAQNPKLQSQLMNTIDDPLSEADALQLFLKQRSYLLGQGFISIARSTQAPGV